MADKRFDDDVVDKLYASDEEGAYDEASARSIVGRMLSTSDDNMEDEEIEEQDSTGYRYSQPDDREYLSYLEKSSAESQQRMERRREQRERLEKRRQINQEHETEKSAVERREVGRKYLDRERYHADTDRATFFENVSDKLKMIMGGSVVFALVIFVFLIVKVNSVNAKLKTAEKELQNFTTLNEDYNNLKMSKEGLDKDYADLKKEYDDLVAKAENPEENPSNGQTDGEGNQTDSSNGSDVANTDTNSNTVAPKSYTVKSGDTFWAIAEKVWGKGSGIRGEEIMKANNITNENGLQIGQVLIIP